MPNINEHKISVRGKILLKNATTLNKDRKKLIKRLLKRIDVCM